MKSFLIFVAGMAAGWYLTSHNGQVRSAAHKAKAELHNATAELHNATADGVQP